MLRTLTLALVTACSAGVHSDPLADAPHSDAPPDSPPDTPPPSLTQHHYIIDSQKIPTTNNEARAFALDLNGDAQVDNQLGMVVATFATQGFDVQKPVTTAVDRGQILMLVDLGVEQFGTGAGSFTLLEGANPQPPACNGGGDTTCRHHLGGNGQFDVAGISAHDPALAGAFAGGTLDTGIDANGVLHLQTNLLTDNVVTLRLIGARVTITNPTESTIPTGVIAGAVSQNDIDTVLLPAWQAGFQAQLDADCSGVAPTCGCTAGSKGKLAHDLFDTTPNDCTISLSEMQSNQLIQSLLAPDVTVNGQMALSVGIGFTATSATFP
jgi:hypothetical protein